MEPSRHPSSKIALIIQCGYFRARHRFFGSQFRIDDISFVTARLNVPRPEVLKLSKQTLLRQRQSLLESIKAGSIIIWKHINFHGEYDFSAEKMQDSVGLNLPKILAWKAE
ncbi:MAG: DUF4158 domain-containing protein [Acidobacteriota bacterium]|nr:DUF4158 domain-containing protein [Acidobacteriota bacterium]